VAIAVAPWRGAAARAAGVAGSARALEKGLEPGTDVGGIGIEGLGSFAGALEKDGGYECQLCCLRVSTCCVGVEVGCAHHQQRTWAWCVRTRLKMLFAEGPKIAAAMRDMLATLGPGVCSICVPVPVRGMDLVEHAPKREKVWGKIDGIPDESPKTLGYSGRSGPVRLFRDLINKN
jgi:hypothetical protein